MHRPLQCVDHRVAGDEHLLLGNGLQEQVRRTPRGRAEVERREPGNETPIGFLRKGRPIVAGAQTRFDVRDRDALVERGQRATERGRRISLDEHPVRSDRGHGLP